MAESGRPCEFPRLIIALILEVGVTFCVCVRPALKHDRHVVRHDEPGRGKDDAALLSYRPISFASRARSTVLSVGHPQQIGGVPCGSPYALFW
jgi:hypothetical protein